MNIPSQQDLEKLWDICEKYVIKRKIYCPEMTIEDKIYETAPDFIGEICDIVGYFQEESLLI